MEHIKQIYDALNHVETSKLCKSIRLGRSELISALSPVPLDAQTAELVLQYGRGLFASEMTAPYLLSEYVYYMYDGTPEQFATSQDITPEHLDQSMYSGQYWHDGAICSLTPVKVRRRPVDPYVVDSVPEVADFVAHGLLFGEGRSHVKDIRAAYCLDPGMRVITTRQFSKALEYELKQRQYTKTATLRIGDKVSTGYIGISVKNI